MFTCIIIGIVVWLILKEAFKMREQEKEIRKLDERIRMDQAYILQQYEFMQNKANERQNKEN